MTLTDIIVAKKLYRTIFRWTKQPQIASTVFFLSPRAINSELSQVFPGVNYLKNASGIRAAAAYAFRLPDNGNGDKQANLDLGFRVLRELNDFTGNVVIKRSYLKNKENSDRDTSARAIFKVGEVVCHKKSGIDRGVVIGWSLLSPTAASIIGDHVQMVEVLRDGNSVFTDAADKFVRVEEPALLRITHDELSRYFLEYNAKLRRYIPNESMLYQYPMDFADCLETSPMSSCGSSVDNSTMVSDSLKSDGNVECDPGYTPPPLADKDALLDTVHNMGQKLHDILYKYDVVVDQHSRTSNPMPIKKVCQLSEESRQTVHNILDDIMLGVERSLASTTIGQTTDGTSTDIPWGLKDVPATAINRLSDESNYYYRNHLFKLRQMRGAGDTSLDSKDALWNDVNLIYKLQGSDVSKPYVDFLCNVERKSLKAGSQVADNNQMIRHVFSERFMDARVYESINNIVSVFYHADQIAELRYQRLNRLAKYCKIFDSDEESVAGQPKIIGPGAVKSMAEQLYSTQIASGEHDASDAAGVSMIGSQGHVNTDQGHSNPDRVSIKFKVGQVVYVQSLVEDDSLTKGVICGFDIRPTRVTLSGSKDPESPTFLHHGTEQPYYKLLLDQPMPSGNASTPLDGGGGALDYEYLPQELLHPVAPGADVLNTLSLGNRSSFLTECLIFHDKIPLFFHHYDAESGMYVPKDKIAYCFPACREAQKSEPEPLVCSVVDSVLDELLCYLTKSFAKTLTDHTTASLLRIDNTSPDAPKPTMYPWQRSECSVADTVDAAADVDAGSVSDEAVIGDRTMVNSSSDILALPMQDVLSLLHHARSHTHANYMECLLWMLWMSHPSPVVVATMKEGLGLMLRGQDLDAIEVFQRVLRIDPLYCEAHNQLSFLYHRVDNVALCDYHAKQTLHLFPEHFGALSERGISLYVNDQLEGATSTIRKALAVNPWKTYLPKLLIQYQRELDLKNSPEENDVVDSGDSGDVETAGGLESSISGLSADNSETANEPLALEDENADVDVDK